MRLVEARAQSYTAMLRVVIAAVYDLDDMNTNRWSVIITGRRNNQRRKMAWIDKTRTCRAQRAGHGGYV